MKIIHLIFRDHWSPGLGWKSKEYIESQIRDIPLVAAIGFLVKEDDDVYCIASNVAKNGDIGIVMNVLKSTVVYKKFINLPKEK